MNVLNKVLNKIKNLSLKTFISKDQINIRTNNDHYIMNDIEKKEERNENLLTKGWNDFVGGLKNNFETFQKSLENQTQKNIEEWEKNKEKADRFFNDVRQTWDEKIQKFSEDIKKKHIESQEQWEANVKKFENDMRGWQNQVREDWKESVSDFNKQMIKSSYMFLLFMVPILIVIIVIAIVVGYVFQYLPTPP